MQPDINSILQVSDESLFTTAEAARMLGKTTAAFRALISRGRIKGVKVVGTLYITGKVLKSLVSFTG